MATVHNGNRTIGAIDVKRVEIIDTGLLNLPRAMFILYYYHVSSISRWVSIPLFCHNLHLGL